MDTVKFILRTTTTSPLWPSLTVHSELFVIWDVKQSRHPSSPMSVETLEAATLTQAISLNKLILKNSACTYLLIKQDSCLRINPYPTTMLLPVYPV